MVGSVWIVGISKLKKRITIITKKITYKPEEPGTYNNIPQGAVCNQASFMFDQPLTMTDQHWIELVDGQMWLCNGTSRFFMEGKWTDGR